MGTVINAFEIFEDARVGANIARASNSRIEKLPPEFDEFNGEVGEIKDFSMQDLEKIAKGLMAAEEEEFEQRCKDRIRRWELTLKEEE